MRHSLRVRLPLLISGLIALSLVVFLSVSYRQVQRALQEAGEARAQASADQLANLLTQSAQQQLTEVHRVAQDAAVRGYLQQPGDSAADGARQRLATIASAGHPAVELWDGAGQRLLSVPAKSERPVPSIPASQRPAADGVGPFQASGPVAYWEVVGAVAAEPAGSPGTSPAPGPQGFVVIRRVLTRGANSESIRKLVGAGAVIKLGNVAGGAWSDLAKVVAAPRVEVRAGTIPEDVATDGERLVGAASEVRGTPWIVLVELPRAPIMAPARAFVLRMLAFAACLVLVAGMAAHTISARITKPLAQLTRAAEAIAQGRFEERVQTRRRDEIGRLAVAFETMATEVDAARRQLETRVEERTRSIGQLNTELDAFSYSVSHDLRAPLRHIGGFAALLQKRAGDRLDAEASRHLRTIVEAAARMGRLIDDLLAFSRMGRVEMLAQPVNLDALIQDVVRDAGEHAGGRHINWTTHPLPQVAGDAAMLRLVFANLVSNAVKYTAPRALAEIEIGAQPAVNGERVVYVRDNGVGFDMTYVDKLFGVFQRLHTADQFEGTGIGLANVRRIIQRHGGRTWAEGAVDGGATFFVSLRPHEGTGRA